MRKSSLLLLLVCFLLASIPVHSKCPWEKYIIRGTVKERTTKNPIEGARIFVFLEDHAATANSGAGLTRYPDFFLTSRDGRFEAASYFNTFKRTSFFGDVCGKRPKSLEIFITKEGYPTKRKKFTNKEFKIIDRDRDKLIELPEIRIDTGE
jgi:hypothetical protein